MESSDRIKQVGEYVTNLLLEKNAAYGDSALNQPTYLQKDQRLKTFAVGLTIS